MRYMDYHCKYEEKVNENGDHLYVYSGPYVDKPTEKRTVMVPADGLFELRQGAKIQEAFPNMSADDREFLISGLSADALLELDEDG